MSVSGPETMTWTELLNGLRSTPGKLRELLTEVSREKLCERPDSEGWSICETVGHLCALELPYRARLLRTVLEDNPRVAVIDRFSGGYDPETPIAFLLDAFAGLRADTVAFLEDLAPSARGRPAQHVTLGPITLRNQVEALLAHDQRHLAELSTRLG